MAQFYMKKNFLLQLFVFLREISKTTKQIWIWIHSRINKKR